MDSVRLGRVLGRGARGAARTLLSAVDAATAPNPNPDPRPNPSPAPGPAPQPRPRTDTPSTSQTPGTPSTQAASSAHPDGRRGEPILIPPTRANPGTASSTATWPRSTTANHPQPPQPATRSSQQTRPSPAAIAAGTRRFGQATWSPIARLSGVLWLEFTGVFFGLFALSAGLGAWRLRAVFATTPPGDPARAHLVLLAAVAAIFTWFCASSFIRARRRGRRA